MASIVDPPPDGKSKSRPCTECEGSGLAESGAYYGSARELVGCPACDGTGRDYCVRMGELCSGVCPECRADLRGAAR